MGHHQHGHALLGQLPHDGQHLPGELRVEGRGGLIEEDDLRVCGQTSGDCHALLLPAGKLAGVGRGPVRHAHLLQHPHADLLGLGLGHFPGHDQPLGDVLQGRLVPEQIVVLEDKGGLFPDAGNVALGGIVQRHRLPVEDQLPVVGGFQKVDAAKQGSFSRAAFAQNGHHIALFHGQAHALQHAQPIEGLVNILDFQHCHTHTAP